MKKGLIDGDMELGSLMIGEVAGRIKKLMRKFLILLMIS